MKKIIAIAILFFTFLLVINLKSQILVAVCSGTLTCCSASHYSCPPGCTQATCPGQCTYVCDETFSETCVPVSGGCYPLADPLLFCERTMSGGCYWACTPSCSAPFCGQSDGCGGTCSSADTVNYGAWQCGTCNNPGGCGTVTMTQSCNRYNACGGSQQMFQACGTACNECGPFVGAWSACSPTTFTRSRTITYSCSAPTTQTEDCRGTISGTLFDASLTDNCITIASQPKISGATVTLDEITNYITTLNTTTDGSGNYTHANLRIPDNYNLSLSLPAGSPYIVDPPKLYCDGGLTGIALSTQGQAVTRRIGLWRIFGGWFQVAGGGIYANGNISLTIPGTCQLAENQATCNDFTAGGTAYTPLVVAGSGGTAGTVYYDGTVDLGGGGVAASNAVVSAAGFNAASSYSDRDQGFEYFRLQSAQYSNSRATDWDGSGKPSGAGNNLYISTVVGTLALNSAIDPAVDETFVIFHDGDVSITGNITVPQGAYLAVIASGSIRVDAAVTEAQGVYIANGNFEVLSTGDTATEQRFTGEGTFVGLAGVSLLRDRGVTNNGESSEYFIFRPDFVINATFGLKLPSYVWREVAP